MAALDVLEVVLWVKQPGRPSVWHLSRIVVTILAWGGPFLFAPAFILETLLPSPPKPLLWLRL